MATAHVEVKKIEFLFQEELTICNLFYESDEPGTPWGGGWKTKTFPNSTSAVDIMATAVWNFLEWSNGRTE